MEEKNNRHFNHDQNKSQYSRLLPVPNLDLYDNGKIAKNCIYKSIDQKSKSFYRQEKNEIKTSNTLSKPKLPKSFYIIKLREWAEEIPIIGLQSNWENNIHELICNNSKFRYPQYVEELIEEVRNMYINDMQQLAIQSIVMKPDENLDDNVIENYLNNRYEQKNTYQTLRFLKNRDSLKNKYFLSHNLMRQIMALSTSILVPQIIVDFSYYHTIGLIQLSEISRIIKNDIKNGLIRINNKYYTQVSDMILNSKSLQEISPCTISQFMRCATNLFVQQIINIMIQTIKHMINAIKDKKKCPQIQFELVFENASLTIKPTIEEVKNMFYDIIGDIEKIGQNLSTFKLSSVNYGVNSSISNDYMCIKMPEWFIKNSKNELEMIVISLFEPLNSYYGNIVNEFSFICSNETHDNIIFLVSGNYDYDIYYEHVRNFDIYLKRANSMVSFLYYRVGRLSQIHARETLKKYISSMNCILVDKLINYHIEYNRSIYHEFEKFKSKALNIPNNASDLFELNDNMVLNADIIVNDFEKKVEKSIKMLITLLDITSITEEHMTLNSEIINCLCSIKDIVIQSNTLCEAMKSELEDELQKKINTLNIDIDNIFPTLVILNDMDDANRVHEYIDYLNILVKNIEKLDDTIHSINTEEKLFKFPETQFSKVNDIKNIVLPFFALNRMIYKWKRYNSAWLDGPFEYIDADKVEKLINFYLDEFTRLNKSIKTNIKLDISSFKLFRFSGIIDDPDPMQQPAPMKLCFQALEQINKFKQYVSLINCICNNALEQRHWNEISIIYGSDITPNAGTTLRKFISLNLMKDMDKYHIISVSANKELALQKKLKSMYDEWKNINFTIIYDEVIDRSRFVNFNEIQIRLDEHLTIIQEMKGSYFVKPIASNVENYNKSLTHVCNIINQFNFIQDELSFLRLIFTNNKTFIGELENVAVIYSEVEKVGDDVKNNILRQPTFYSISQESEFLFKLLESVKKVEMINNSICTYLNNSRLYFPRFFFLSNNELVMILFRENIIEKVKNLYRKCFRGIKNVKVDLSEKKIISIISDYNEELPFKQELLCNRGDKNELFKFAECAIIDAVRKDIYECICNINEENNNNKLISMKKFSLSITAVCAFQIIWTANIQKCFIKFHPDKLNSILNLQNSLITTTINNLKDKLSIKERIILMAIATAQFHQREIINLLIEKNISDNNDFNWIIQLRYYWQENNVIVNMVNASRQYGYEFSTVAEPTITTSLTDRCHRTIIEAARHYMFVSLIGPTGTGKTETIRALTRALAVPFHIINYCKNLSFKQISMIFKGLIACGAWVCFKNINTAKLSVLSAATHYIYHISQMLSSKCTSTLFDGSLLTVKPTGFIITTANHYHSSLSSKQYILPDNFRSLFRLVAFQQPDISKICETRLFAAGFFNAKKLANKIQSVYEFCIEQYSYEKRYDFSCTGLNAILNNAINLKFEFSNDNEDAIILRSLIDINLPMFSVNDTIVFQEFLNDIFPNVNLPSPNYTSLLWALDQVTKTNGIQAHHLFKLKIIQILEMTYLQNIFILIGDASSGKTTLIRTLVQCLSFMIQNNGNDDTNIGADVQLEIINQKSMTMESVFGYLDQASSRWNDGVYTTLLRNHCQTNELNSKIKKWIIFDGPIESTWTENLNIILGENNNRTLSLSTGELIEISKSISVIFETDNIEEASPATISRCGIIYLEQNAFGYKHYIITWILEQKFHNKYNKFMKILIEWSLNSCLEFIYKTCQFIIAVDKIYLVISTLRLCSIYIKSILDNIDEKDNYNFEIWVQIAIIQSIIWTFGACLSQNSCGLLNEFCILLWSNNNDNNPLPEEIKYYEMPLPSEGMIQDNTFIFKGIGHWKHWSDILKSENISLYPYGPELIFIPTIDTIKHIFLFNMHIKYRMPFIVCGNASTGKTTLMQYFLYNKLPITDYTMNLFNFTQTTVAHQAQKLFLLKLNRIMGDHYAPPKNKFCINFIDDFSIGPIDNSSQKNSLTELIRQFMDHAHWYSCDKPEKLYIKNIMFLCGSTLNGNEQRKIICPRFIRHFNLYTLSTPNRDNLTKIFSKILYHNLIKNQFTPDIMSTVNCMINATIDIYTSIINQIKLIPINIQNQFNIRDISRVINGCSLIHKESVETKISMIRLWVHESIRVFGDRMTNKNDKEFLFSNIKMAINAHFKDNFESIFDNLPKENNQLTQETMNNLIFANFMDTDKDTNNRRYEEVGSIQLLNNRIINYLNEFNNNSTNKLDISLLSDVLEHLIRVCRILTMPGGNLLMICAGGLGRKSISRLAAYIERQDFFQYTSSQYFNSNEWRENLKYIIKICGGIGKQCTFFIPTRYIKDIYFEDINNLMTTGEIPYLISPDERQKIVEIARLPAQNGDPNLEISIIDVMNYFFNQCRKKLHFILYYNVSNYKNLRRQIQLYPNILKYSDIDYFMAWPLNVFVQLGNKFIQDISIDSSLKDKIIIASKYFYDESKIISEEYYRKFGRLIYITPAAFIHMMQLYSLQIINKQQTIKSSRNKYLSGLQKLQLAAEEVAEMQKTLMTLKYELESSAQQTEETMRKIENENISVENATIQVKGDEEIANKAAKIAATLKSECEADLAVAIPILEDAIAALNTLKPNDITLVKAMKNPPDTVKLVMAAVCVMLNIPAERVIDPTTGRKSMDFWGPSKRVLGDMNFLQTLKDYNKNNISPSIMQIIKKTYMTDKNFMPHIVTKASSAAEGLCKWVRAMVSYDEVAKIVAPKKEKLAAAEIECNKCLAFLNEKRKTLSALNNKLTALKSNLQATLEKKFKLENEVTICTQKLVKAETLITSLGDEKDKWFQTADKLKQSINNVIGDLLISCGIIVYLAPYHSTYRNKNVALWLEYIKNNLSIPCSSNYNFIDCLGPEVKVRSYWQRCGLPKDHIAHENAVILNNSMQFCLFIDPQSQANMWIKQMEVHNQLNIIKLTNSNYLENIVKAIELNQPVMVENINDDKYSALCIDCILSQITMSFGNNYNCNQLLTHNITNGNSDEIMNNYLVPYNCQFRLYMTTKLHNPYFDSYVFKKLTIIDFLITENILQNKLLDIIISREKPEIHEKFDILLDQSVSNMILLKQEEDNILTILSKSTINILQDDESMKILDNSKNLSIEIIKKEKCANITKNEIDEFRKRYSEFTHYCAVLYNTLLSLSNLNCMYKFSLDWFIQLYIKSIMNSRISTVIQKRLEYLMSSFTTTLHSSVLITISNKHKLLYSFLLCLEIQLYTGKIKTEEINVFISENLNIMIKYDIDMSVKPNWLSQNSWKKIIFLSKNIIAFDKLETSIKNEESLWLNFYNSKNPQFHMLPFQWQDLLSPFQKLIIFKIIRPDRVIMEIEHFISTVNGSFNNYTPLYDLSYFYSESSCLIPLIFILPSYIEPVKQIEEFAISMGYTSKFRKLSLGDNHEEHALQSIYQAQKHGDWVLLENCHLASNTWILHLENIFETIHTSNSSLEFRLWLSTAPTHKFPISILQNGIKIMCDTPLGLKQNLITCYHTDPLNKLDIFTSCPGKDKIFSKFLYSLTFFHVLVKEKNNFGIHGWNIKYNFCHSDLTISISELKTFIQNSRSNIMLLQSLTYLIGECIYGGKLIDNIDHKCLLLIFQNFCNSNIITQDNYEFSVNYSIPNRCERHDYINHIKNLPDYPTPELFGIDEYSIFNQNSLNANEFILQLSQLNGSINNYELMLKENVDAINIEIIRNNLPIELDLKKVKQQNHRLNPLNEILVQEVTSYNTILELIKESLMKPNEELIRALTINILPKQWYSFPTFVQHQLSLSTFIDNINKKYNFFNTWINSGCPMSFWLGNFVLPNRFISLTRVMFARHYKIPIHQLIFNFQVLSINDTSMITSSSDKVFYLHNLHLTGASWDIVDGKLKVGNPRILSEIMPIIRWKPQLSEENYLQNNYSCPLYKSNIGRDLINHTGNLSNFIIQLQLPTNLSDDYWIKRGTSLFCQLENNITNKY